MSEGNDWQVIWFTLGMSALSTLMVTPLGIAVAWMLARKEWRGKSIVETIVSLPLVLPPVATGFLLLRLFGRKGVIGSWLEARLGIEIVFTWKAVVLALGVMAFPLLVRTMRVGFEQVDTRLEQVARTLGARPWRVFLTITLPLARRGVVAGVLLGFARALGEFGATILVAGAIPGKTATMAVAIFNHIQLGEDGPAYRLLVVSVALAFVALLASEILMRRKAR